MRRTISYSIVVLVAALLLPTVAWGLACKLPGNITATCVPLDKCSRWQGFLHKIFIPKHEMDVFTVAMSACHNGESDSDLQQVVCCAMDTIIKEKTVVAPECLQDRLGDGHRHNGTYPDASSFIAYISSYSPHSSLCSGSLITSEYVLTTAHCVKNYEYFLVYIGATYTNYTHGDGNYPDGYHYEVELDGIIVHEGYDARTKLHDIALIRLPTPVDFSLPNSPKPVCISSAKHYETYLSEYKALRTFGWGQNINGDTTSVKQVVYLEYISVDHCRTEMKGLIEKHRFVIDERIICTHTVSGHNAFTGFSGSPLLYRQNNVWFMVGLVCCGIHEGNRPSNTYPLISTSFASHREWIVNNINQS